MCIDVCIDMCIDMCIAMYTDICINIAFSRVGECCRRAAAAFALI